MKIVVVDTETNGRKPPEVIELSYAPLEEGSWEVDSGRFYSRYMPKQGSTVGAISTHHIQDDWLEGFDPSSKAKLDERTQYIIGHGIDYDWEALGSPPHVKRICTVAMSRYLYPDLDSHRLGAMIYHFHHPAQARTMLKEAHSAEVDVILCTIVLHEILRDKQLTFRTAEELWEFSEKCRVPRVMPFGKWSPLQCSKEVLIKDLPYDYKMWCLKQETMDQYVLRAIRESL